jgi:GT2 family glycosyltransferase
MARRLRPRGPTAEEYRAWRAAQHPVEPTRPDNWFVIALDPPSVDAREPMIAAFATTLPGAACVVVRGQSGWFRAGHAEERSLDAWLRETGTSWIWWIGEHVTPAQDAGHALALAYANDSARIVYGDHDVGDAIVFKPAWDREQIAERDYAGPALMVHAQLADAVDEARAMQPGAQWRMLLLVAKTLPEAAFVHVPRVLARLHRDTEDRARRNEVASSIVEGRHGIDAVSVVIPIRDRPELLARCVDALIGAGFPASAELVVVDNGSVDPATARLLHDLREKLAVTVVPAAGPFNFPRLCNMGVANARGRVIVLLNNDTAVTEGWLDELAALAARPRTGAVGPLLLYPDGRIQSAGVLGGVNRTATSALEGFSRDDATAREWCATRRRVTAVMGACLAVEREKYLSIGGMDERFAASHNEVDFCLRLEAAGLSNVFTPFACVVHEEGATRGFELTRDERDQLLREEQLFRTRWGDRIRDVDPAHHPAFSRDGNGFVLLPVTCEAGPRAGWQPGR